MDELTFSQQLILTIVESGLIGLILLIIGFLLNRSLAKYQNNHTKLIELEKQNNSLKNNIIKDKRERTLAKIDKQLAEFYFPIFYRLQKDDALWRLSPKLSPKEDSSLPFDANEIIEKEYILKNHLEIVEIIEAKSHLIEIDSVFQEQIREYIKHVAVYNTIRKVSSLQKFNPVDLGYPYPMEFQKIVETRINVLQQKHKEFIDHIYEI